MFFLKKDAVHDAASAVAALQAKRDALAKRLLAAERQAVDAEAAASSAAAEGADDTALDKAEKKMRACRDRVATLASGLARLDDELKAAQDRVDVLRDQHARNDAAAKIEVIARNLEKPIDELKAVLDRLASAAGEAAPIVSAFAGIAGFSANAALELDEAVRLGAAELRHQAKRVLAGELSPRLPGKPAPLPAPVPAPRHVQVMPKVDIAWLDHAGGLRVAQKNRLVDAPADMARRARERGLLHDDPESDFATKIRRGTGQALPHVSQCIRIDLEPEAVVTTDTKSAEAAVQREPIFAEPFVAEPMDRGAPYVLRIPAERAP